MGHEISVNLICGKCGNQFVINKVEQKYYQLKGLPIPTLCRKCRVIKAKVKCVDGYLCSHCGIELKKGSSIFCNSCMAGIHLDAEKKSEQRKKETSAIYTKLQASELKKAELEEKLRKEEQKVLELEEKLNGLGQDLEKAVQFHTSLEWIQPIFDDIQERLKSVENSQYKISERMLQLVEKMHQMYESAGVLEIFKRSLRRYGGEEVTYPK